MVVINHLLNGMILQVFNLDLRLFVGWTKMKNIFLQNGGLRNGDECHGRIRKKSPTKQTKVEYVRLLVLYRINKYIQYVKLGCCLMLSQHEELPKIC